MQTLFPFSPPSRELARRLMCVVSLWKMAQTSFVTFVLALYLSSSCNVSGRTFSNTWAVNVRGGPVVLEKLARKLGFVNETQVGGILSRPHKSLFHC